MQRPTGPPGAGGSSAGLRSPPPWPAVSCRSERHPKLALSRRAQPPNRSGRDRCGLDAGGGSGGACCLRSARLPVGCRVTRLPLDCLCWTASHHDALSNLCTGPSPLAAVRADQAADTADTASIELISEITGGVDAAHTAALQRNAAAAAEGLAGSTSELKQKVRGLQRWLFCRRAPQRTAVHTGVSPGMPPGVT